MFHIQFDPSARVLHLRISGFWNHETAVHFADDLGAKVAQIMRDGGAFTCLSDARNFPPQSAQVARDFGAMAATATARKCAILVGSTLAKLQASRTMANDRVQVFLDEDEARAWLSA